MSSNAGLEQRIAARPAQRRIFRRMLVVLAELGVDPADVLARCELEMGEERAVVWPAHGFWEAAAVVSGQPGIGVRLAERMQPQDYGLLGELVANSATLGEALLYGLRLSRLSLSAAQLALHADGDHTCVTLEPLRPQALHREEVDFIMTSGVLAVRVLTGRDFVPVEVSFAHSAPPDTQHYRRVFRAPLRFGAPQTACTLPTATLLAPLPNGDSHLRSTLAAEAERRLAASAAELPLQVRSAILAELRHGDPSIERVAARIGTYPRKLTRKLRELGLSYRELLSRTRFELAEQQLRRPETRVTAIADALGYSDKSAFIRAFKRRAGCAPFVYRERMRKATSEQQAAASARASS